MQVNCNRRSGAISIFFAITMLLVISILLSVVDGIRIEAARIEAEQALMLANHSLLSEYHFNLANDYGIFAYDSKNAQKKAKVYFEMNLANKENKLASNVFNTKLVAESLKLTPTKFDYKEFKFQILEYMKFRAPLISATKIFKLFNALKDMKATSDIAQLKLEKVDTPMQNVGSKLEEVRLLILGWQAVDKGKDDKKNISINWKEDEYVDSFDEIISFDEKDYNVKDYFNQDNPAKSLKKAYIDYIEHHARLYNLTKKYYQYKDESYKDYQAFLKDIITVKNNSLNNIKSDLRKHKESFANITVFLNDKKEKIEDEIKKLENDIDDLEDDVADLEDEIEALIEALGEDVDSPELDKKEKAKSKKEDLISDLEKEIDKYETELQDYVTDLATLKQFNKKADDYIKKLGGDKDKYPDIEDGIYGVDPYLLGYKKPFDGLKGSIYTTKIEVKNKDGKKEDVAVLAYHKKMNVYTDSQDAEKQEEAKQKGLIILPINYINKDLILNGNLVYKDVPKLQTYDNYTDILNSYQFDFIKDYTLNLANTKVPKDYKIVDNNIYLVGGKEYQKLLNKFKLSHSIKDLPLSTERVVRYQKANEEKIKMLKAIHQEIAIIESIYDAVIDALREYRKVNDEAYKGLNDLFELAKDAAEGVDIFQDRLETLSMNAATKAEMKTQLNNHKELLKRIIGDIDINDLDPDDPSSINNKLKKNSELLEQLVSVSQNKGFRVVADNFKQQVKYNNFKFDAVSYKDSIKPASYDNGFKKIEYDYTKLAKEAANSKDNYIKLTSEMTAIYNHYSTIAAQDKIETVANKWYSDSAKKLKCKDAFIDDLAFMDYTNDIVLDKKRPQDYEDSAIRNNGTQTETSMIDKDGNTVKAGDAKDGSLPTKVDTSAADAAKDKLSMKETTASSSLNTILSEIGQLDKTTYIAGNIEAADKEKLFTTKLKVAAKADAPDNDASGLSIGLGLAKSLKQKFSNISTMIGKIVGFKFNSAVADLYVDSYIMGICKSKASQARHKLIVNKDKNKELIKENSITEDMNLHFKPKIEKIEGGVVLPKTGLEYEVEYVLYGNADDKANVRNVSQDIILLRIMPNFIYIMTHSPEKEFASSTATLLTSPLPFLQPVVNFLIIFIWATSESTIDVHLLQAGRAVQFYKSPDSFVLTYNAAKAQQFAEKVVGGAVGKVMEITKEKVAALGGAINSYIDSKLDDTLTDTKALIRQKIEDAKDYALGGADDYAAALDTYIINYLNMRKEYAITKQRLEENIAEAKAKGTTPDNMPAYLTDGEFDAKKVAGYTALQAFDVAISEKGGITSDGVIKLIKASKPSDESIIDYSDMEIIDLRNDISGELEKTVNIVIDYFTNQAQQYVDELGGLVESELETAIEKGELAVMNAIEAKADVLKQKSLVKINKGLAAVEGNMSLPDGGGAIGSSLASKFKLKYEDYLSLLLFATKDSDKLPRLMDIIQLQLMASGKGDIDISTYTIANRLEAEVEVGYVFIPQLRTLLSDDHYAKYENGKFKLKLKTLKGY